jgi:uncharacterized protein YdcH (DUF465 family)
LKKLFQQKNTLMGQLSPKNRRHYEMGKQKKTVALTTKTGVTVETNYCRKCMKDLPASDFYESTDGGLIDSNGLQSVCKQCTQELYTRFYDETNSIEKAIHRLCTSLNIKYSNEAVDALKAHVATYLESGKSVNSVFGIYKSKLMSVQKTMDKNSLEAMVYEDVGTVFMTKEFNTKEIPIPQELIKFWGSEFSREDIEFLENQYASFKNTHSADTYAQIVLLKEVCYTMLTIKLLRKTGDDTKKEVKELQELMKNLAISPNATITSSAEGKGADAFGLWIQDIEREEPAQWLKSDPRGDMYRDVGNVEEYFQKYIVRPLKNFILSSKDFNIDDNQEEDLFEDDDLLPDLIKENEGGEEVGKQE